MDQQAHHKDFQDPRTGAHARITGDALVVFTNPAVPGEYHGTSVECPLHKIAWVKAMALPGGQTAVALGVDGEPKSPGLTFSDAQTALEFEDSLRACLGNPLQRTSGEDLGGTARIIREEIVSNASARDWLYVGLAVTDWKHYEEEQEYLRADGAIEVLYDIAHKRGLADAVAGATEEGRRRLRQYMQNRKQNGPARLAEVEADIKCIDASVPQPDSREAPEQTRVSRAHAEQGYADLQRERASIRDDLKIADDTLRYLEGEDIRRD